MNRIDSDTASRALNAFASGASIRQVAALCGIAKQTAQTIKHRDKLMEVLPPVEACWNAPSKGSACATRRSFFGSWESGLTPDVTCGNPLCILPAHMTLRRWKNPRQGQIWTEYANRIAALRVGEWIRFENYPKDEKSREKFRCGVTSCSSCRNIRFSIRSLPSGGILVTRTGTYENMYGLRDEKIEAPEVMVRGKLPPHRRPLIFFLGFLSGALLDRTPIVRPPKCKVRGCIMPTLRAVGDYCHHHNHFFDWDESMTWNGFDPQRLFNPRLPLHSQAYDLAAEFLTPTDRLERTLIYETQSSGLHRMRDDRHKNMGSGIDLASPPRSLNYSRAATRLRHRLAGKKSTSSKTTRGRHRRASSDGGSRDDSKHKRWTRELIESLERQADNILKAEMGIKAEEMRIQQSRELALLPGGIIKSRRLLKGIYPLGKGCPIRELWEPSLDEEQEREAAMASLMEEQDYFSEQFGGLTSE